MDFTFPDLGEGVTEGEVVVWHVKEGDTVEQDQVLVEVETDKALVEIPSPIAGTVTRLLRNEGETIPVGDVLLRIQPLEESDLPESSEEADRVSLDVAETSGERPESTTVVGQLSDEAELLEEEVDADETAGERRVLATPATRRLARELGVELSRVRGTGEEGRITPEDVRRHAGEGTETGEVHPETGEYGSSWTQNLSATRRAIADRMERSAREIPHATHMDEADVEELFKRVDGLGETLGLDVPLTMIPILVRALIPALRDHPRVNAVFDRETNELRVASYYNIGISVDTEEGLLVPVIKNAGDQDLRSLARTVVDLSHRARDRTIDLKSMQDGTFTLSNIGVLGGQWAVPKINPPQVAVMVTGRARPRPVVREGTVVARRMLPISVAFDHRVLDGADVARFTNTFVDRLQHPDSFLPAR